MLMFVEETNRMDVSHLASTNMSACAILHQILVTSSRFHYKCVELYYYTCC